MAAMLQSKWINILRLQVVMRHAQSVEDTPLSKMIGMKDEV